MTTDKRYTYDMQPNFSRVGVKFLGRPKKKDSVIQLLDRVEKTGYWPCLITHLGPEAGLRTDAHNTARPIMKLKVGFVVICKREHFINVELPNGTVYQLVPDDQILSVICASEIDEDGKIIPEDGLPVNSPNWAERCFMAAEMLINELGVVENAMPEVTQSSRFRTTKDDDGFYASLGAI